MRKILAMLLAMVMVLGMSVTALAAPDSATIKVTNIEGKDGTEAELSYLQIIVADQTTETGWAFASPAIEAVYLEGYNGDSGSLNAQGVIQELINAQKNGTDGYANTDAIGRALSHVAALDGFAEMSNPQTVSSAGVYAVKAVQEGYTYNNMAAYVGFGEVAGQYPVLQNATLAAKRVETGLDKSHDDQDKVSAIGQTVTYTIKTNVPYIDPLRTNKTYFIHDEITGAEYVVENGSVQATITKAGEPLTIIDGKAVVVVPTEPSEPAQGETKADNAFYIDLSGLIDDQNSNAGQEIVVTYTAKVTAVTVDNKANAGHKDGDSYGSEFGEDEEDVYTGQITLTKTGEADGERLADAGFEVTDASNAVVYFTKDEDGKYSHVETADVPQTVKAKLDEAAEKKVVDRAELELTEDGKTYVRQVFTTTDGTVFVQGLNVGTYIFTEKTAPEGYSVNETPATAELKVTESDGVATQIIQADTGMTDTRLNALPSTGGIGTTIFTIGGCAIMIIAAGLFFATRRKKAK